MISHSAVSEGGYGSVPSNWNTGGQSPNVIILAQCLHMKWQLRLEQEGAMPSQWVTLVVGDIESTGDKC